MKHKIESQTDSAFHTMEWHRVKSRIKNNDSRIFQTGAKLTVITVKTLLASISTNNLNDPYNTNNSNYPHNQNIANNPSTSDNNKITPKSLTTLIWIQP